MAGLYTVTYIGSRVQGILVHKVRYQTVSKTEKKLFHTVTTGDFGVPMLTGVDVWHLAGVLNIILAPLRVAESLFWHVYPRKYDFNRQNLQNQSAA